MKRILLIIVLALLAAGWYFSTQNKGVSAEGLGSFSQESWKQLQAGATEQFEKISVGAQEVGKQAQRVLGLGVQVNNDQSSSIQDRAIEYGQYLYCKQVVTAYEEKQASESAQP
jgi:hypothetical protein